MRHPLCPRRGLRSALSLGCAVGTLGVAGDLASRALASEAPATVWAAETIQFRTGSDNDPNVQFPVDLIVDSAGRPLVAWTESAGSGRAATGWWAQREDGRWQVHPMSRAAPSGVFSLFDPNGGAALALSTNQTPFLFYGTANFGNAEPYFVSRANLETAPEGPGSFVALLRGFNFTISAFDADGRASHPPDVVSHSRGWPIQLNGDLNLTGNILPAGMEGELVFRQGPQRQIHVLYQADTQLRYNGGAPDRDLPILAINGGSSPHAMAIDDANEIHVSAAQGTGRFFFGAVGQLAYLHSPDGTAWTTNLFTEVTPDVGATAIALDSKGRPGIAFTRAFGSLFYIRRTEVGWTTPTLLRTGLGGWDRSRSVHLAFGPGDVPHIAVHDQLSKRLIVLSETDSTLRTDLALNAVASTNRVRLGSDLTFDVTVTNAGPRNATATRLRLQLPTELVVRDVTPRPIQIVGSVHTFDLGTVYGLEPRSFRFTVAALDPVRVCVEAAVETETGETDLANNRASFYLAEFIPSPCLDNPAAPGCQDVALLPANAPPALAHQPWSLSFRAPLAPSGSRLQLSPTTLLPPGFCLTADGELRGIPGDPGTLPLTFDLVEPGGRTTSFLRDVTVAADQPPEGLIAFWPLDGHGLDTVRGVGATLGPRGTFLPGPTGLALQSARDALNDPRDDLARPAPLFTSPPLLDGAPFGKGPVTVTGWFRRDGGARARGDARPFGFVFALVENDTGTRERFLAFDPAIGRLDVLDGPPDRRANVLPGPVLPANTWYHLAMVCDATAVRVYTNGALAIQGTFRQPLVDHPRLVAGGWAQGGEFSGTLDELALFQKALGPADLDALRSTPLPRQTPLAPGTDFPIAATVHDLVLPDAPLGEPYQATLHAAFCGTPESITLIQGALPAGITLSSNGLIRGASKLPGTSHFRVRGTDAARFTAELNVSITTREGLPVFTRQPTDQQLESGDLLILLAETRGPASLQWFFNARAIPGETNALLAIPEFSFAQSGRYQLRASNPAGITWSQEVRVGLRTAPTAPPVLDVAPIAIRPDGVIRLRLETLRGRVYELQRAMDLSAALSGGWRTVQRFLSPGGSRELTDVIAGRPDAAFYRIVEVVPPPASPFSTEDATRFVGIAQDGEIRPGLLPAEDPATGRLGAFEFRVGGEQVPLDQGLILRLPDGAQPVSRDGQTALRFRSAELFFGEESPVQLNEGGTNRVALNSGTEQEIPSGPLSVEVLERLLGKPQGSGIGLTFFRHFHFQLISGTFDGTRIRNAQMAWADRAAGGLPTPDRTGNYLDFDIELAATHLRLPFYGEFSLPDSSGAPAKLVVSKAAPLWVELRPGPEIALGGRAKASFANGPELEVDFLFDQPVFRASLAAKRFRLPENLSLRRFLPALPAPLSPTSLGLAQNTSSTHGFLDHMPQDLQRIARAQCASSSVALRLLGDTNSIPDFTRPLGLTATDDDLVARDFTQEALAELKAWTCVVEAAGGFDELVGVADSTIFEVLRRSVNSSVEESSPIVPRGAEIGPMTYAYRTTLLGEVAALAIAGHTNNPNPQIQPFVDQAYESVRALTDADPAGWDTTTLVVAAKAIAKAISVGERNPFILPPDRTQFLLRSFEALIRARGEALRQELNVARGTYLPDNNPTIYELHRWEAMARIRQALRIHSLAQVAGIPGEEGDPVGADVLGQLAHHAWSQILRILPQTTNACTPTGFHTLLAASPEIAQIARIADHLRILGITNDLPQPIDAMRFAIEAEQRCATNSPPVLIRDLLRNDPENLTARAEAHLALLEGLPVSINSLTPEVAAGISAAGQSLKEVLSPARAIRLNLFGGSQLIRILKVALRHDELRRRFKLAAEPDWLGQQLPSLTRLIREKSNGGEGPVVLSDYNELLLAAAIRQQTNTTRPLSLQNRRSPVPQALPAVDAERLNAYYEASRLGVEVLNDAVVQLGAHLNGSSANAFSDLADLRLPGGLTVEKAYGELTYHQGQRRLSGAFGGDLRIPGAGLHLNLVRAEFSTGGSFSGELYGSLALPPTRPLATLSIPSTRPARLAWTRGHAPTLSGGGRLRLENGATLDGFLSLEDPVYHFSASASSIRLGFTRKALEQVGIPFANQLPAAASTTALHYLSRLGLLVEGARPDPIDLTGREILRRPERRPLATDSDDVAANAAALRLLTTTDALDVPPTNLAVSASSTQPGPRLSSLQLDSHPTALAQPVPTSPTVLSNGAALVRVLFEQLERSSAAIESDTASLSGLDQALLQNATPVPAAEITALRGPKLIEVARRLGSFGADFSDAASALSNQRGREIIGSASSVTAYEATFRSYLNNTRDGLLALRSNLLVGVSTPRLGRAPWNPSEHWDRIAATNALAASLRFEVLMQHLGFTDAALSQPATEVGCAFLQTLIDERLESLGLDPATGAIPASGGALATYLALDHEQAREALQDLLLYESWLQSAPACQPPSSARLHAGIAAAALRLRDLVVDDLQDALDRIDPATAKAWERPERILAQATNLFPAITLPESLGLTRYPAPTFPILPRQPGQTIDDPRTDATDLLAILGDACGQLAVLTQDETSGYPAELRRRRASPLPPAGPLARLLARYADLPGIAPFRESIGQLAEFEASLLQAQASAPDFPTRMGRDAAQLMLRVLNTARLLDEAPATPSLAGRQLTANVSALRQLTDTVLPNLATATRTNSQLPWWVASEASRALLDATETPWKTPGVTNTLHNAAREHYATARSRLAAFALLRTNSLPDLALPGQIEIRRLYGSLVVNRETHYVLFEVGGRLEFPLVRTGPGQTAFIELRRLRLETNGRFAFEAATRTPLPFPEASFAGSFQASGDFPHRALSLAGDGTLTFVTAPANPDSGAPFPTSLAAFASYAPIGYDAEGRPDGWRFTFNAEGTFRRSFGPHFAVFGAGAGLVAGQSAAGNPIGGVSVGGSVGLFRKSNRLNVEPPLPADFHLLVENAQVEIVGTANENGSASLTAGTVKLPDFCYPTDLPADLACDAPGAVRTGPSVAILNPIRLRYEVGGKPRLEGALRFSHFGARLGTNNPVALTVCQADLGLDANGLPFLDITKAGLGFTIPSWDRGLIRLQSVHLGLDGRIQGQLFLAEDFDLVRSGDFRASLLGATSLAQPGNLPPGGCLGTALILEDVPGFDAPRVTLSGGIRIEFPANFLSDTNGARVGGVFCGGIRLQPTANGGPQISAFIDEVGFTGDFAMGPRALKLRRASIVAGNFEGILRPDPDQPFYLSVSGDLQAGPFTFGLTNAQLRYRGLDIPPAFGLEAIRFARDATQPLPPPLAFLPASVEFAELRFKESSLPANEMFRPDNIQITTSLRVGLPTVQQAFLGGAVSGLVFNFRENGELIPPPIDGFDLTVSGTAGLKLPALGDLGGKVRIGGLRRAFERNSPSHIYAVGQLSGTQQGFRIAVLGAFNLAGPIGMCLDVNLGAAGFTLTPTPFQITGASGGFAFLTTDNPCDFTQYFVFDPATGTYQLRQTLELPSLPIGMPWAQFTETLERMAARAEGFARNFDPGSIPLPGNASFHEATRPVAAGVSPAVEPGVSPGGDSLGSSPVNRSLSHVSHAVSLSASPSPQPSPEGEGVANHPQSPGSAMLFEPLQPASANAMASPSKPAERFPPLPLAGEGRGESGPVSSSTPRLASDPAPTDPSPFGCPGDCPPRTVAILCQPHPDEAQFPNRVIFKFSSIPESLLTNARPTGLGIDAASLAQLGSDAPTLARNVANRLVDQLAGPPPGASSLPPNADAFLAEQQRLALEGVRTVAATLIEEALRRSPDAYAAIRDELYKGIPCPDISLALAGRMSMVGLSAFGWVEGRQSSSLSGSGGVVGELHVLGVPMGQARAFISTTDSNGDPNPSVCGQLTAALGPLDLGRVDLALRCEGCVTELLRLFPTLARAVGEPFLRSTLDRVAPDLAAFADRPDAFIARLRQQAEGDQLRVMLGLFTEIQSAGPGVLPGNLGSIVRDAVADTWSRINPEIVLCGDITPRLLGLPLTLGGRSFALNFLADKTGILGEFAFSPSALVPLFPPGDEASLSFAFRVQDPYAALLNSFDGRLNRADTRNAFIREQAEFALQNMVVAANYQWHPFGLELGDAAIRVLTPDLLDHPALPGRNWRNPDERADDGLPSRDEVLVQAAASGKLGRAFEWIGSTNDLADIFAAADPRGTALREQRMDLRRHYFPHGGIVGGARMALPRILMAAREEWQPLHDRALHGTNLFDQIDGALTLLNDYVLRHETNGTAAFYIPAPNPPLLYASNGRLLSADEVRRAVTADPDAFSADGLMRQIRSLNFSASESLAHLYPDHLAFLRAEMTNLVLFGAPVFGTATLTGKPSPLRVIDGQPLAHLEVRIAGNSPVGKIAGGEFAFGFDLYASPAESIATWATQIAADLRRQRGGGSGPALAGGSPALGASALNRFQAGLVRQLPRFATTNTLPPLNIVDPREWAGSGAPTVIADDPFSGGRPTPNKRPPAKPVLRAELALHAFSPFYQPDAPGDGPVAEARRQGGLAASGLLEILPETPGQSGTGQAEFAVTLQGNQPRLIGRVRSLNLPTPFVGISLQNAQADFDSQASTFLRAHTSFPNLGFSGSLFRLESAQLNQPLAASLALRQFVLPGGIIAARSELELAPARLSSDLVAGRALIVHGPGNLTNPITVSETRWLARASLDGASSVAAGVSPAVEGGVSPGGISQGSGSVNTSVLNKELSASPSPQPSPKGEGVANRPWRLGDPLPFEPLQSAPANPMPNPSKSAEQFLPLPPAGEGRGEGRSRSSSLSGSLPVSSSFSNRSLSAVTTPDLVLRADLAGARREVVRISGLPANPFAFEAEGLDRFTARFDASLPGSLTMELFPGLDVPGLPQKTLTLRAPSSGQLQLEIDSQNGFTVVGVLAAPFNAGNPGSFATDAEVRIDSTGATFSGRIGTATGSLQVAAFDNRIEARFSGQVTLPSISALGGRITLAAPDGGDLAVTVDANGSCVSGAVLTLQNFAPNVSPTRIVFPRLCLDANRAFRDLAPAASTPSLHAGADPDLPIGAFEFGDLRSLQLSGNFNTRSVSLAFQADLKLGSLLAVPVRGSIGSEGLRFVENATTTRLLGFDFSNLRLGATNILGDLPDLAFAGRLAALPARLRDVEFLGRIPGTGGFSLMPASPLDLPELIPAFPLLGTQPALNYRPEAYAPVVRASDPSGYWSLDEASGAFLDRRLAAFRTGVTRRSGEPSGAITYSQDGAFATGGNRAARFNGTSSHVRLPFDALAPQLDGFAVSLWFRRPNNLTLTTPQTLVARGTQWSLHLAEAQAGAGTRIQFTLGGLRRVEGSPSTPLIGQTRVDDLNWHHVVAVHDGVAQYLYLDGNLDAWQPVRGAVTPVAGLITTLGATLSGATATRFFSGWLDEVALFPAPLSPIDILAQGLAAGRSGLRLTGRLEPNRIPGLPAPSLDGILSPNGDVALTFGPGGTGEFGGIRLPEFQGTLLRRGTTSTVTFQAGLVAPGLETLPIGIARGVFEGSGVFAAHASSLADRAVFGWNLRLTNLTLTGNWQTRTLASTIGARLTLPYDIASFAVAGDLDTTRNRYTLRGTAGGAFSIGPNLPFSYDAEPVLREDLFKLSGRLALGNQAEAARFNTSLEVKKSGEVHAGFSGVTDWIGFPGIGFGQLRWKGALAYVEQQPSVGFVGILGLATPNHPLALEDLPEGLDFNAKGPIAASLRTAEAPITVSPRGKASVRAEPSFQGKSYFDFNLP